jgi:hypothetical protein
MAAIVYMQLSRIRALATLRITNSCDYCVLLAFFQIDTFDASVSDATLTALTTTHFGMICTISMDTPCGENPGHREPSGDSQWDCASDLIRNLKMESACRSNWFRSRPDGLRRR